MKKRHIWVLGLVVWQAITLLKKDTTLREKIKQEPWIIWKIKLFWEHWIADNKDLLNELSSNDWEKTAKDLEKDIAYDTEKVKWRTASQADKNREKEWENTARTIINAIPSKKTLAEWVEKYKTHLKKWWDNL